MMKFGVRSAVLLAAFSIFALNLEGRGHNAVVVDSISKLPLPNASIFDNQGNAVGICSSNGRTPYISDSAYPITIRYLGFTEKVVADLNADTIFLQESATELPDVVIESREHKVMHLLAYVREYSTLTTYNDTVFLFREKMVDYMLNPDKKVRFQGWSTPRPLKSKSYYRFTNGDGLDSVSDNSNQHFSWSDWIGMAAPPEIPARLKSNVHGIDTIFGKYSPTEIWTRNRDSISVDVNVLADTASRKWVTSLAGFFRKDLDFENFRVRFNYDNVVGDSISPMDITGYSFAIESNGRGRNMFRFNKVDEPFFVSTYAEVYIIDKEFITLKEARKWARCQINTDEIDIFEPMEAPELQPSIQELVDRVNSIDSDEVRLARTPDTRLMARHVSKQNFAKRALAILKGITGITAIRSRRHINKTWREFRKEQIIRNHGGDDE